MKSVQKLSPSNDGRHLFFVIVQAQGSALLLFLVTVSLSLSSHWLREATCISPIGQRDARRFVLWHSSPSHRLNTRFSSSVLKRTLFERLRSPSGLSRFALEPSMTDITESRHCIIIILPRKKKTSTRESAKLSQSSPISSNQHDSLEPARFSRISPILSLAIPATEPCRYSPTASFH